MLHFVIDFLFDFDTENEGWKEHHCYQRVGFLSLLRLYFLILKQKYGNVNDWFKKK